MRRELLLGCGGNLTKKLHMPPFKEWQNLTTVDINPDHHPTVVWDLEKLPLPFEDNSFDEIHAYDVLEHLGQQGDYKFFFAQFEDFARILRPGGLFFATVPPFNSEWCWGDPSHKRVISQNTLTFLSQEEYTKQVGITPMSDFRYIYKADFVLCWAQCVENEHYRFLLKVNK